MKPACAFPLRPRAGEYVAIDRSVSHTLRRLYRTLQHRCHDMPMPGDMGHFRRSIEKRRFTLIAGLVSPVGRVLDTRCRMRRRVALGVACEARMPCDRPRPRVRQYPARRRQAERLGVPMSGSFSEMSIVCLSKTGASMPRSPAEIIEHLDSPEDALREIARVVRPGGTIIVSTPLPRTHRTNPLHTL